MNPKFAALADEFEARVRAAKITETTEVTLIYRSVDADGRELPPVRVSLVPETRLAGTDGIGPEAAADIHRDTILANINSLVRHAPEGIILLRGAPPVPRRIVGFDLEISSAADRRIRLLSEGESGASFQVPKDLLDRVRATLDKSGVSYWVEHTFISVNGRPPVAFVHIRRGSDIRQIQTMLESAL